MSAAVAKPTNPSAHVDPKSAPLKEIPDILVDSRSSKRYARGKFLGKGGFAKCYEITDLESQQVFAGKIVPKSLILKQHQREKMTSEITIHKSLHHDNIVGFHGFFEDDDFVFVVLEICRRRVSSEPCSSGLEQPLTSSSGSWWWSCLKHIFPKLLNSFPTISFVIATFAVPAGAPQAPEGCD